MARSTLDEPARKEPRDAREPQPPQSGTEGIFFSDLRRAAPGPALIDLAVAVIVDAVAGDLFGARVDGGIRVVAVVPVQDIAPGELLAGIRRQRVAVAVPVAVEDAVVAFEGSGRPREHQGVVARVDRRRGELETVVARRREHEPR